MIASVPILYISYNFWVFWHCLLNDILQYKPLLVTCSLGNTTAVALADG